ncbi:MAG TPA: EamA family transporter [Vineibacter sp.]|nr:EamA family transporter [Vineibacter sp.]
MIDTPPVRAGFNAWLGWILLIAFETASQVFLKAGSHHLQGADGIEQWLLSAASSPAVILGFIFYFLSFLAWMTLLRDSDVSWAFPMTAIAYVTVLGASVAVLGETVDLTRCLGVAVIIAGVVLLAGDGDDGGRHP